MGKIYQNWKLMKKVNNQELTKLHHITSFFLQVGNGRGVGKD